MLLAGVPDLVKNLVRLVRGEALVTQMDGQTCQLAQLSGESLRLCRLAAVTALQMQRIADNNAGHIESPGQPRDGAQVFPPAAAALQRQNGLCGKAQFVGHGHPDAAVADVEAEESRWSGSLQINYSGNQLIFAVEPMLLHPFSTARIE